MIPKPLPEEVHVSLGHSVESDIVDEHRSEDPSAEFVFDHHIVLSRPSSRLGFNRDGPSFSEAYEVSDDAFHDGEYSTSRLDSATQTRSDMLDSELGMDITALALSHSNASPTHLSLLSSCMGFSELGPDDSFILSDGEDSDLDMDPDSDSSYSDLDEDLSTTQTSHLHSTHPTLTTSQEPELITRSRPTSPLSLNSLNTDSPSLRQSPSRHSYGNHGYSRHALYQIKGFWAAREDEWLQREARLNGSKSFDLFDDIPSELSHPRECYSTCDPSMALTFRPSSPRVPPPLPPLSIHPRRGDISALRDPYCAHIDRCFVGMPLWTMSKTLWMFDLHSSSRSESDQLSGEGFAEAGDYLPDEEQLPAELLDRPYSAGFSDDSDSTLVESDGEVDSPTSDTFSESDYHYNGNSEGILDVCNVYSPSLSEAECSSANHAIKHVIQKSQSIEEEPLATSKPPFCARLYGHSRQKSVVAFASKGPPIWYRRWEVLLELYFESGESIVASPPLQPTNHDTLPMNTKTAKFFIPDDEEIWEEDTMFVDDNQDEQEATRKRTLYTTITSPFDSSGDSLLTRKGIFTLNTQFHISCQL